MKRWDIIRLAGKSPVGIELGVAEGIFSENVLENVPVSHWYSVDMWAGDRGHDDSQRHRAETRLKPYSDRNTIIWSTFKDALDKFSNNYFDIIYVDGYAHTGQEGGKTLTDWWPKLKPGGIMAGDDYDPAWPLTQQCVDQFVKQKHLTLTVFEFDNSESDPWSKHPSWWVRKPHNTSF